MRPTHNVRSCYLFTSRCLRHTTLGGPAPPPPSLGGPPGGGGGGGPEPLPGIGGGGGGGGGGIVHVQKVMKTQMVEFAPCCAVAYARQVIDEQRDVSQSDAMRRIRPMAAQSVNASSNALQLRVSRSD